MMLSVNLKDSVLTTQSSTNYVDLKSNTKKYIMTEYEYIYKKTYVYCTFSRSQYNSRTCLLKKTLSLLGAAPNRQNFEGSDYLYCVYCTNRVLCYISAFGLPELDLLNSSGQALLTKTYWVSIHTKELRPFQFRLSVANILVRTCFVFVGFLLKGKLPLQSLIPSLSANNLIPLNLVFLLFT